MLNNSMTCFGNDLGPMIAVKLLSNKILKFIANQF